MWERESERERERMWRLKQIEDWRVFAGNSQLSIPRNDAYALHMTGMRRDKTSWRQLCFASSSQVRPSCETLVIHTFYTHTIYTYITHRWWGVLQRENPSHKPWELEIVIPTFLYTIACGFSSTPTSPFPYHWKVDSPNTYHTLSECQVRF